MGYCRLGLAVAVALGFLTAEPASSASVSMLAAAQADATRTVLAMPAAFHHHARRSQSYYCYPRNYWWFYRPYTTDQDGHARCMPYFKYPTYGNGREAIK